MNKEGPKPIHGHRTGGKKSSEYATWSGLRGRCNNPRNKRYKYYGGRGIKVCLEIDTTPPTCINNHSLANISTHNIKY